MPQLPNKPRSFKPPKTIEVDWKGWNKGWNNFFRALEIEDNELSQADNLMLVGKGTPTKRWGSKVEYQPGDTGRVRFFEQYRNVQNSVTELLAITDDGYLTKQDNASYSIISGFSFVSGVDYEGGQLDNNMYIAGYSLPLTRYDGTNLLPYTGLDAPTNALVTNISGASGLAEYAWRVTASSKVGETLGSTRAVLSSLPLDLSTTLVKVTWDAVSAASGDITGYNVYRGQPGDERFLSTVGPNTTEYLDYGDETSDILFPPLTDSTQGPRAKFMKVVDDRIVLAGIAGDPNRLVISARFPYQDRFNAAEGGGYIYVSPDDGDEITGVSVSGNQTIPTGGAVMPPSSIIVFKKNSVHRVILGTVSIGNFVVLNPIAQQLTASSGCSSNRTVANVGNDLFYFGRKGLFTVGQEPNFLNQIRTNEISARIRNYVDALSDADVEQASADFINNKYILSFPNRREAVIYDFERACFMGPWKFPFGATHWRNTGDTPGKEKWLSATFNNDGPFIREFSDLLSSDSGTAVRATLRTKKSELGIWAIMKVINLVYVSFRGVEGSVSVRIRVEGRDGTTTAVKVFQIEDTPNTQTGWGANTWGSTNWGTTTSTFDSVAEEIIRFTQLFTIGRTLQIEVASTGSQDKWELLGTRITAQPLGEGSLPSNLRV